MATISEKNTRRYRVQFSMSRALYQAYEANMDLANRLKVTIDFTRDFEKWFAVQLDQVARELQQLESEQGPQGSGSGATKVAQASVVSAGETTTEGGADHGDAHK